MYTIMESHTLNQHKNFQNQKHLEVLGSRILYSTEQRTVDRRGLPWRTVTVTAQGKVQEAGSR